MEPTTAPKPSFIEKMSASRPKTEAEFHAMEAGTMPAPTPPPVVAPPATPPVTEPPKPPVAAAAPVTPPVTTPAATDPDSAEDAELDKLEVEFKSGKSSPIAANWNKVKASRDKLKKSLTEAKTKAAKAEEYEKELVELRKKPVHNADIIKKIEAERDEYKSKHDAFMVQFTPEFQAQFEGQIAGVVSNLKSSIGDAEATKLVDLLRLPDSEAKRKAISELTDGMDALQIAEVAQANRDLRTIQASHKESIAKAHTTMAGIHENRRKQDEERQKQSNDAFDNTFKEMTEGEKAHPLYTKKEGDKEWNKAVDERIRVARAVYNGDFENDGEKASAAFWATAAPGLLSSWKSDVAAKDAEITQLKETLTKLQGANPTIASASVAPVGRKMTFTERMVANAPM